MNTEKRMFGGVVSDAPLWMRAPEEELQKIVDLMSSASYHFADDSAKEWRHGHEKLREAADLCAKRGLKFSAIERLYRHTPQLVAFDQFVSAVMTAYWKSGIEEARTL